MRTSAVKRGTWNDRVYDVVKRVPTGRVATYGLIAAILGNPRWSRQVGWALHACDRADVPCHRVVFGDGRLAPHFGGGPEVQRYRLRAEGVSFVDGLVDLEHHLWRPRR